MAKIEREGFMRIVTTGDEAAARAWVTSYFGIAPERIDRLELVGPADPTRYKEGANDWHVYLKSGE